MNPIQQALALLNNDVGKPINGALDATHTFLNNDIGKPINSVLSAIPGLNGALQGLAKPSSQTSLAGTDATPTPPPTQAPQHWYADNTPTKTVLGAHGQQVLGSPDQHAQPSSQPAITQAANQLSASTQGYPQISGIAPEIANNFNAMLTQHILPITRQYGVPDAIAAAQAAQESGYMQKPAGTYNFFGLKSNSHPGFASFQTPEQAATYYAQTIKALVPNLDKIKGDPMKVLQALQGHGKTGNYEGDNPNPEQYIYDVSNNPVWTAYKGGSPMSTNPQGWKK